MGANSRSGWSCFCLQMHKRWKIVGLRGNNIKKGEVKLPKSSEKLNPRQEEGRILEKNLPKCRE